MPDPSLNSHIQQIQNIQIAWQDLEPLLPGSLQVYQLITMDTICFIVDLRSLVN